MSGDSSIRSEIMLSVQRALLGAVTPNLRSVVVDWDDRIIRMVCYYHNSITDEEREIMSVVHTEVATDFVDSMLVEISLEHLAMPAKMMGGKARVYLRKE